MTTIKDIAQRANVSISTVSYALNGNPLVSAETSSRILSIAKEMNYMPNAAARFLKTRKTQIVGVFLASFSGSFYDKLLRGMQEVFVPAKYSVIICSGPQSQRLLTQRMLDGAAILDRHFSDKSLNMLAAHKQPIVVLDRESHHDTTAQVLLDNVGGATQAMDYCYGRGFRRFYIVTGPTGTYDSDMRLAAVQAFLRAHPDVTGHILPGAFDKASGARAAEHIISHGVENAVSFCFNDEMAVGMYNYLQQTTFEIGKDVHIMGFDNIELSQYLSPRLTTINYSLEDWGRRSAQALLNLMQGNPCAPQVIHTSIFEGQSVGRTCE
ncbi:MAG: LacI family DNA-binding transcriptional regulator [Eubacteriales bacterium]|nr:LacI family DNA-binding transcriptional regulator [Christensenellaceae bacterium]MEA5065543.1 LacI family DNA-binding transcriptional regulator [Eubacteriales bacterium]